MMHLTIKHMRALKYVDDVGMFSAVRHTVIQPYMHIMLSDTTHCHPATHAYYAYNYIFYRCVVITHVCYVIHCSQSPP